jgi:hypothetical protein
MSVTTIEKERGNYVTPALITCAGIAYFLLWRNSTLFLHPRLWAEDLFVYFADDRILGVRALLEPYQGYVQFCCRLVAFLAGFSSPEMAPRLYETAFVAVVFATAAVTFTSPAFDGWAKSLAALALVVAPVSSEVFLGMCYMQWVMAPVVALALYENPTDRWRSGVLFAYFFLVGASGPFVLVGAPFVAFKAYRERGQYSATLLILTAFVAFLHLHGMVARFGDASSHGGSIFSKLNVAASILYNWWLGEARQPIAAIAIGAATLIAAIVYLLANGRAAARPAFYFSAYGVVLLIVGAAVMDISPPFNPNQWADYGRYFYIPMVLFIWTFAAIESPLSRQLFTVPAFTCVLALALAKNGSDWGSRFVENHWEATVDCLKHNETACIPTMNPSYVETLPLPSDHQLKTLSDDDLRKFRSGRVNP